MKWNRYALPMAAGVLLLVLIIAVAIWLGANSGTPMVGICIHDMDDPAAKKYAQMLEKELAEQGFAVTVLDGRNDQSVQTEQIDRLIEDGASGLLVSPVMTSAAGDIVEQVKAADLPTVFIYREPSQEALMLGGKVCYVGCGEGRSAGILQGQMVKDLPDQGDINGDGVLSYVFITGQKDSVDTQERTLGATLEMISIKNVSLSELETASGDGSRGAGRTACAKLLSTYGKDIEVVLCNTDAIALGALEAIEDGGREVGKDIYLFGIDGDDEALEQVKAGKLSGTVQNDLQTQTQKSVAALIKMINGESVIGEEYVDYIPVTN